MVKMNAVQKMLQAAAYKLESRPVLQDILYRDGNVYACDSHQLVRFSNVSKNKDDLKINSISLLPDYEHNYPDLEKIIVKSTDSVLTFDIDDIKPLVNFLKQDKKGQVDFNINCQDKTVALTLLSNKAELPLDNVKLESTINTTVTLNIEYLLNCLSNLKAFQKEYDPQGTKKVTINFGGSMSKVIIEYLNMTYLIAPMRKY